MNPVERYLSRWRVLTLAGLLLATGVLAESARAAARLEAVRVVQQDTLILHIDIDSHIDEPALFMLDEPHRLVIDLPATSLDDELARGFGKRSFNDGVIRGMRYGRRDGGVLRLVFDLRRALSPEYRIVNRQRGVRLVVDLKVKGSARLNEVSYRRSEPSALRDVVVAIDAGHGGKDPGAIGPANAYEKDIVLSIARRLFGQLAARPGISPVLIREDDVYIGLGKRLLLARQRHADLFVSLHADAFKRREASGSSVYALSRQRASSEAARWLAAKEIQQAALFGEVNLGGMHADLAHTLLDLAQTTTLESSLDLGGEVLDRLGDLGKLHKAQVEQANFAVLTSPDMPSILIETGFISNDEEARRLADADHQARLATAIAEGIANYLARRAPAGTLLYATRQ